MPIVKSFNYFVNKNTKILIIGTMPGKISLQKQEYYGNNQNAFWKIISVIFNNGNNFISYKDKLRCLKENHIGLWDSLKYCIRDGSLDSNIKNEFPNDFKNMLKKYIKIKYLLFNGNKSYYFFRKYNLEILNNYKYLILPSTSPTNAKIDFNTKLKKWKQITFLNC